MLVVVSVVRVVALVVFVVVVARVVVLEPKSVARVHAQVDVEDFLHHPHACLTSEVPTVHVVDLVFFDEFWWQDSVFKKHSFVFSVSRVHVASLDNLVVVSHCLHLVIECFPNDFVSNIFQAFDFVAVALNVVFGSKGQSVVTQHNLLFLLRRIHFLNCHIPFALLDEQLDVATRFVSFPLSFSQLGLVAVRLVHGMQ